MKKKQDNGRWDPMPCFSVYSERTVIYFWLRLLGLSGIVFSNCPDSKSGLICFKVKFLKSLKPQNTASSFLDFCITEKSKQEICSFIGYRNLTYFTRKYLNPLLESGQLKMTIPDKPNSRKQKYITVRSE